MDIDSLLRPAGKLISYFEAENIRNFILNLDKQRFMILAGITSVLVIILLLKRMIRWATFIIGVVAIIVLLHFTIPEKGQNFELSELVTLFVGGTFIVAASLYIIFIRSE
jgi:bacteriorhodopsin